MKNFWAKVKASPLKIAFFTTLLLVLIYIYYPFYFFEYLEGKTLDVRFLVRGDRQPGPEIVLITIDERSMDDPELGRWPWDREKVARGIDLLSNYGAGVVGLDIIFAEPQRYGKGDEALSQSIKETGNVALGYFMLMSRKELEHLSKEEIGEAISRARRHRLVNVMYADKESMRFRFRNVAYYPRNNIGIIDRGKVSAGYFNMFPDQDGTVRMIPMVLPLRDNMMPSLSLQIVKKYFELDNSAVGLGVDRSGVVYLYVGDIEVPVSNYGELLVNYRGPGGAFPRYSFADLYHEKLPPEYLRDKIVIIGATATGIYDMRVTPFSKAFPGLEVHASAIDNIIHQDFIRYLPLNLLIDVLLIIVFGFLLAFIIGNMTATMGGILSLGVAVIYLASAQLLFSYKGIALNIIYPAVSLFVSYTGVTYVRFRETEFEKKQVREAFQYYVSENVAKEMLKDPSKLKLGGEKKELTVMFSDIRGFTSISETLEPEKLHELLNEYLTAMTDVVFKHEGTVDKYMGDAIMTIFGAPLELNDHPLKSCRAAIDMLAELQKLHMKWREEDLPLLDIGIGINTGSMVVGNMGSKKRFEYTVLGDNVNLGSRLEGLNKQYRTHIIISEFTYRHINSEILCRELDMVAVKGKAKPVRIYEVLTPMERANAETIEFTEKFKRGLSLYRDREFQKAIEVFDDIGKTEKGDIPSRIYIQRCTEYLKSSPPEDWDGVFHVATK